MRYFRLRRWKPFSAWTRGEKLAALAIFVGVIFGSITAVPVFKDWVAPKKTNIPIFVERHHLGDNTFSRVGGSTVPQRDASCLELEFGPVIYFDKEKNYFFTRFGYPDVVQFVMARYGPIYAKANLAAWQHVRVTQPGKQVESLYPGASVQLGGVSLVWQKNKGNFYDKCAVVALARSINLYSAVELQGVDPEDKVIKEAIVKLSGFHGGRRPRQPDNVDLFVNGRLYAVTFKHDGARTEERIPIPVDETSLSLDRAAATDLVIAVRPYQETYPIPPPGSGQQRRGPGHFRDVEIWNVQLELVLR